jgi:hypothetical protein
MTELPPTQAEAESSRTCYGFTRAEWIRAATLAGGAPASVVAHWEENVAVVAAGGSVEVSMASFVALGRLGPEYARRASARFEPHFSRDLARWADAVAAGATGLELLRRFIPRRASRTTRPRSSSNTSPRNSAPPGRYTNSPAAAPNLLRPAA